MPIWRAARSTIWSASPCRRCCGASCPARARPAACNRSRCGSSAIANSKSRNSSPANTGRSSRRWRRRAARPSKRASSAPTARRSSASTSAPAPRPKPSSRRSRPRPSRVAAVESKPGQRNPYPPFTTSTLQQEASRKLGFAPAHTMRIAQRLYEGVDIGGETVGLITYMRTDGVQIAEEALPADPQRHRRRFRRTLSAGCAAPLPDQGEERAGSARGDPPDRRLAPAARRRAPSRCRPGQALRADLDAHGREPDGVRRDRAHHRRHHGQGRRAPARTARHRLGDQVRRLPARLSRRPRRAGRGRRDRAACRR